MVGGWPRVLVAWKEIKSRHDKSNQRESKRRGDETTTIGGEIKSDLGLFGRISI